MIPTFPALVGPDFSGGKSSVYFLKVVGQPFVKVGYARDWRIRTRELQCGNHLPLELILLASGGRQAERACHHALGGCGLRGEWFSFNAVFAELVERIVAANGEAKKAGDEFLKHRCASIRERVARYQDAADKVIAAVLPLSSAGGAA